MNKLNDLLVVQDSWSGSEDGLMHEIEHPLYEDCYKVGMKSIFYKAANQEKWIKKNEGRVIKDERSNILAFIGKRGSGKTTAMDEFCRILKSLDRASECDWWLKRTTDEDVYKVLCQSNFKFHIMKPIDASLFGETEDLFEQIIVNLYRYFQKSDLDPNVMAQYSDIIKCYYSNKGNNDRDKGSSFSIANMMNFASDNHALQNKISKLIDNLLENRECRYEYIVISIDDIDLNLKHGYQMLEQIQKYFAYHKIIILISMDYDQMRLVCEEHFLKEFKNIDATNGKKLREMYVRDLAKDIMLKLFHLSQRIYMPDLERILKNSSVDEIGTDERDKRCKIKYYIMKKIAARMNIYYDICGEKKHFVEPQTIRELVVYNEFLDSIETIDFSKLTCMLDDHVAEIDMAKKINKSILKQYDINYRYFVDDIMDRMTQNMSTPQQTNAFKKLITRDMTRSAQYFVHSQKKDGDIVFADDDNSSVYNSSVHNSSVHNSIVYSSKILDSLNDDISPQEYTYGALLEKIYKWGRNTGVDCFDEKPYIWCILAAFTTEMTRDYLHYRYNTDEDRRVKKYKKRLLGFIGGSFSNKWLGEAFPVFNIPKNVGEQAGDNEKKDPNLYINFGYRKMVASEYLDIEVPRKKHKTQSEFQAYIKSLELIKILECLDFCFSSISNEEVKRMEFYLEPFEKNLDEINLHIKAKAGSNIKLDMMSFVVKSMDYKENYNALVTNIKAILLEIGKYVCPEEEYNAEELETFIKDELLVDKADVDKTSEVAFPFYNLDFSYNVCKRLRKELKDKASPDGLWSAMKVYYGKIEELLREEQEKYKEAGIGELPYYKLYVENPDIKVILTKEIDTKVMRQVENILQKIVTKSDVGMEKVAES